jgi:hypothetical protein
MTIVLIFVILYVAVSIWDVAHVNDLMGKMIDPAGYQRAHPAPQPEPAPLFVVNRQV